LTCAPKIWGYMSASVAGRGFGSWLVGIYAHWFNLTSQLNMWPEVTLS
jgi:hypothetical protein